eukprot:1098853-Rhodomonas_salina.2
MLEAGLESSSPEVVALLEEAFEHARMYGGTGNSISEVIDRAQVPRPINTLACSYRRSFRVHDADSLRSVCVGGAAQQH